jgi:hypothetical protein
MPVGYLRAQFLGNIGRRIPNMLTTKMVQYMAALGTIIGYLYQSSQQYLGVIL